MLAFSGTDKARIVEVGYNAKYLNDLKARVPIEALTAAATSVKERKFESTALAAVTARPDS